MCGDGSDSGGGGKTGGIGFSDTSKSDAEGQAEGKTDAGGLGGLGSVDEQIDAIRSKEKEKSKSKSRKGEVIGTIVGALSPVPGGTLLGGVLGRALDQQSGTRTGSGSDVGPGTEGVGGGGERELTTFPSRESPAEAVIKSDQDKRRALRGRRSTILTSPRGVTTTAPERKTLLGQ